MEADGSPGSRPAVRPPEHDRQDELQCVPREARGEAVQGEAVQE